MGLLCCGVSGVVCRGEVVVTMLCCEVIVQWCVWSGVVGVGLW